MPIYMFRLSETIQRNLIKFGIGNYTKSYYFNFLLDRID
jgi:hypothetical protein